MSNPCETCKHRGVSIADQPCASCCNSHASNWQPMPAPPEPEAVTVEAIAELLGRPDGWVSDDFHVSWVSEAARMLRALRPLVEAEACKRRIVAAGCQWDDCSVDGIVVRVEDGQWTPVPTWPEAAAWAEAQVAKREPKWSEHVGAMYCGRLLEVLRLLGVDNPGTDQDTIWLRGYLVATARERGILNTEGNRIRLPAPATGEQR